MSDRISLFYLSHCRVGGWVTYTVHLVRSLQQCGLEVDLYEVKTRTEEKKRKFAEDVEYQNLSLADAMKIAESTVSIVVALGNRFYDKGFPILQKARNVVLHDTAEVNGGLVDFLKSNEINTITIRQAITDFLKERGLSTTPILHPYVPYKDLPTEKDWNAVSTSRICWDKYTHWIYEANELIGKEPPWDRYRARVYGFDNRAYSCRKLTPRFPEWRKEWYGPFKTGEGVRLAARSRFVIDLTEIKGDGGGTQYTFLEAFDAGAVLILNNAWLKVKRDVMIAGVNCLGVSDPTDLSLVLQEPRDYAHIIANGKAMLANHAPEKIIPAYFDALE